MKIGTLRNLIKRAKVICSDESLVNEKMIYLTKVFHYVNNYSITLTQMKKYISKALPEQVQTIMKDQRKELPRKFNVKAEIFH